MGQARGELGVKSEQCLILLSRLATAQEPGRHPPHMLKPIACGWLDTRMQSILRTVCPLPRWICPTEGPLNGHDNADRHTCGSDGCTAHSDTFIVNLSQLTLGHARNPYCDQRFGHIVQQNWPLVD